MRIPRVRSRRWSTDSTSAAPAISWTAPKTATRSSASSSSTRTSSDRRDENHLSELRRGVRQAIAGVVSVQTKSGTNDFHGSAFRFRQSDGLQARNPFSSDRRMRRPGSSSPTLCGTSSAGRSAGRSSETSSSSSETTRDCGARRRVPAADRPDALARTGDLSEYGVNIFDPAGAPAVAPSSPAT